MTKHEVTATPTSASGYKLVKNVYQGNSVFAFAGSPVEIVSMYPQDVHCRVNVMVSGCWQFQGASGATGPSPIPVAMILNVEEIEPA